MSWSTILGGRDLDAAAIPIDRPEPEVTLCSQRKPSGSPTGVVATAKRSQHPRTTATGSSRQQLLLSNETGGQTGNAGTDVELDELIRACAETDPALLDDLGDFGLCCGVDESSTGSGSGSCSIVDSIDLTVHGIGLRPPADWWETFDHHDPHHGQANLQDDDDELTAASRCRAALMNAQSPGEPAAYGHLGASGGGSRSEDCLQVPHPWAENHRRGGGGNENVTAGPTEVSLLDSSLDAGSLSQLLNSSTASLPAFDVDHLDELF
jgi:hypothetical protein